MAFCDVTSESFSSTISILSPSSIGVSLFILGSNGDSGAVSAEELSFSEESSPTPKLPIVEPARNPGR